MESGATYETYGIGEEGNGDEVEISAAKERRRAFLQSRGGGVYTLSWPAYMRTWPFGFGQYPQRVQ